MSVFTLERSRIRLLKELLRDGLAGRQAARTALRASAQRLNEAGEWRTEDVLRSDWPGMPEASRFVRGVAGRMRSPAHALTRLENLIELDEAHLRRMLTELVTCLAGADNHARAQLEFAEFWREIAPEGPPALEVLALVAAGGAPQLPAAWQAPPQSAAFENVATTIP